VRIHSVRLALIAAAVFVLPLGIAVPASASGDWAALHRPLQLKPLKAGARCPVTRSHPLDHGRLSGVGVGPVFALPSPFGPDGRHPGWIGSKTLWTWPARLLKQSTRVLVRGRRLDQSGAMRFQLGPNWDSPLRPELRITTTQPVGSFSNSTWGTTVTMLFGRTPGCYGIQLDTGQGTTIIVIAA
jgi:hypothetical protein